MKQLFKSMYSLFPMAVILGLASCGGEGADNSLEKELMEPDETTTEISEEEIFNLIETFPTPVEMALVIQQSEYDFSSDKLLPADSLDKFVTSYEKAMAMGAYGADMGYLNIYSKVFAVPDYLKTVRTLSKDLDLDSFFDFESMLDMAESMDNIDSLIQMSTESFNAMEAHLREQGRDEISLLIVFGTWLEGAYIIADAANTTGQENLRDHVAQQKEFVKELSRIFKSSSDEYFNQLAAQIRPLEELYDQVEIEVIEHEPTETEVDGMLVFIDNTEIKIHADEQVIEDIITGTKGMRNSLLK